MKTNRLTPLLFCICIVTLFTIKNVDAQLNTVFEDTFEKFLALEARGLVVTMPGEEEINHGDHFLPASEKVKNELIPALNSFIAGNISSFPLSSTTAGISFDFSSGQPISVRESLGPIFAETAKTLGKGNLNFGINFNQLNFTRLRGLDTRKIIFNFFHVDVPNSPTGLGDNVNESDFMTVNMDLNIDASIFAFYLTAGITDNFDIGVALPMIALSLKGRSIATFDSFTLLTTGEPNHFFEDENENIVYTREDSFDESAAGIGDVAVRLKYSFFPEGEINLATMLDARLPTGDEENFFGTGEVNVRLLGLLSKNIGDFTPHLNVGYDYRRDALDSDEFEFAIGFDHKVVSGLTFAFDILGEIDIDNSARIKLFPGVQTINDREPVDVAAGEVPSWSRTREIPESNIPDNVKDHILNAAVGFRYSPSDRLQLLANLLLPINNGGLRPNFVSTFGLSISL